jgi:hypothetical protein
VPARYSRQHELHLHLVRSGAYRPPELERLLRMHPEWPQCASGCGWLVDPGLCAELHTGCVIPEQRGRRSPTGWLRRCGGNRPIIADPAGMVEVGPRKGRRGRAVGVGATWQPVPRRPPAPSYDGGGVAVAGEWRR